MCIVRSDDNNTAIMYHEDFKGEARLIINDMKSSSEGNGWCFHVGKNGAEIIFDASVLKKLIKNIDDERSIVPHSGEDENSTNMSSEAYTDLDKHLPLDMEFIKSIIFDAPAVIIVKNDYNPTRIEESRYDIIQNIQRVIHSYLRLVYICKIEDVGEYLVHKPLYHMCEDSDGNTLYQIKRDLGFFDGKESKLVQYFESFEDRDLVLIDHNLFAVVSTDRLDSHESLKVEFPDTGKIIEGCDSVVFENYHIYEESMRFQYDTQGIDLKYIGEGGDYADALTKKYWYKTSGAEVSDIPGLKVENARCFKRRPPVPNDNELVVFNGHLYIATRRG